MKVFSTLTQMVSEGGEALAKGPIALVFCEDALGLTDTVEHLDGLGFASIILFPDESVALPSVHAQAKLSVVHGTSTTRAQLAQTVTKVIAAAPENTWFHWCYNAEFLHFPFCETRRVGEMLSFHAEERRRGMVGITVDLYTKDIEGGAFCTTSPMMDRTGYYALARPGPDGNPLERQLNFFGGLRWRFEEHVPANRRRIDRVALFRSRKTGLEMRPDGTFSEEEYNTYQCPWHHNISCAVASFRTAKALTLNPGSRAKIDSFAWRNSVPFEWSSRQLMDLGLMEPGQWF